MRLRRPDVLGFPAAYNPLLGGSQALFPSGVLPVCRHPPFGLRPDVDPCLRHGPTLVGVAPPRSVPGRCSLWTRRRRTLGPGEAWTKARPCRGGRGGVVAAERVHEDGRLAWAGSTCCLAPCGCCPCPHHDGGSGARPPEPSGGGHARPSVGLLTGASVAQTAGRICRRSESGHVSAEYLTVPGARRHCRPCRPRVKSLGALPVSACGHRLVGLRLLLLCLSVYLVGTLRDLPRVSRRRIAWDGGAIREVLLPVSSASGRGPVQLPASRNRQSWRRPERPAPVWCSRLSSRHMLVEAASSARRWIGECGCACLRPPQLTVQESPPSALPTVPWRPPRRGSPPVWRSLGRGLPR